MSVPHWRPAFVGVGSNLDAPEQQVNQAIVALADLPDTLLVSQSALYRSSPMGPSDQPDFINAVVAVLTQTEPLAFLQQMQAIERKQGRKRRGKAIGGAPAVGRKNVGSAVACNCRLPGIRTTTIENFVTASLHGTDA